MVAKEGATGRISLKRFHSEFLLKLLLETPKLSLFFDSTVDEGSKFIMMKKLLFKGIENICCAKFQKNTSIQK